mgnify:CR=1 FL=1
MSKKSYGDVKRYTIIKGNEYVKKWNCDKMCYRLAQNKMCQRWCTRMQSAQLYPHNPASGQRAHLCVSQQISRFVSFRQFGR